MCTREAKIFYSSKNNLDCAIHFNLDKFLKRKIFHAKIFHCPTGETSLADSKAIFLFVDRSHVFCCYWDWENWKTCDFFLSTAWMKKLWAELLCMIINKTPRCESWFFYAHRVDFFSYLCSIFSFSFMSFPTARGEFSCWQKFPRVGEQ